jgi:DNA-binding protein YbaB
MYEEICAVLDRLADRGYLARLSLNRTEMNFEVHVPGSDAVQTVTVDQRVLRNRDPSEIADMVIRELKEARDE